MCKMYSLNSHCTNGPFSFFNFHDSSPPSCQSLCQAVHHQSQTARLLWLLNVAAPAVTRCGLDGLVMQRVLLSAFVRKIQTLTA